MTEERLSLALARLDRALARLEAGAGVARASEQGLAARHRQLREVTADAIARLDALIAAAEDC